MNPKKQIQKKVINAATFKYEDISQKITFGRFECSSSKTTFSKSVLRGCVKPFLRAEATHIQIEQQLHFKGLKEAYG